MRRPRAVTALLAAASPFAWCRPAKAITLLRRTSNRHVTFTRLVLVLTAKDGQARLSPPSTTCFNGMTNRNGCQHALSTVLLAGHSGPWRICTARAGGCRSRLRRRGAQVRRHGSYDDNDERRTGQASAICAALPEGG